MIVLVTGPPGNGKSFYAVRKAATALAEGKPVATNVRLVDDWVNRMARRDISRRLKPGATRRFRRNAPRNYFYSDSIDELLSVRLHGRGESRGVMVLDEAHNWMNARAWTAEDRQKIVRFASQHRKLGFDVYIIAQQAEMIDKQVRSLFEYHVQLRNLRRARMFGLPITPVNLFLAVWCWHSGQRIVLKREVFPLSYHRKLYDTFQTTHGLDHDQEQGIWLPKDDDSSDGTSCDDAELGGAGETGCRTNSRPESAPDSRTDGRGTSPAGRVPAALPADQLAGWDVSTDSELADTETGDPHAP